MVHSTAGLTSNARVLLQSTDAQQASSGKHVQHSGKLKTSYSAALKSYHAALWQQDLASAARLYL